ncbi:MAG TPA: hypothetical protein VKB80_01745 [Kofleriaceae bacterium]|nr:hypothetical protein [Kofleriaceae bacterium]
MRASSHIGAGGLALSFVCALLALTACNGGDAMIGDACGETSDCDEALQCLERVCVERCHTHVDCGDGYRCERGGECELVDSAFGDVCEREVDCGPGQACSLDTVDPDENGALTGTCQEQVAGLPIAAECRADDECQTGICALGRCTQLCRQLSDCPPAMRCASVPRLFADSAPRFSACLPARGVISQDIAMSSPSEVVRVPVPSSAQSFALVAQLDDDTQRVGAELVVAPDGRVLYAEPATPEEYFTNPIRYEPGIAVSTLFVSNSTAVDVQVGAYEVTVKSELPDGGPGTAVPHLRAFYKLDTGATLDVHFHFLNMKGHPCSQAFDDGRLDAASARDSNRFKGYLATLESVFADAGIHIGDVTYSDIAGRADLDGIERDRPGPLFALADHDTGVNVFFVRSIAPAGVQAVVGATPGPPRTPGSAASGVAVGVDTLCYRNWSELSRITAHAVARQMGLYYNRDPDGHPDAIGDSDDLASNLMFFGDLGGASLSSGQREVLRRYPGLR